MIKIRKKGSLNQNSREINRWAKFSENIWLEAARRAPEQPDCNSRAIFQLECSKAM
jgi:hypothetical protein